jgi:ABC-type transporter Mla MlaB component
MLRVSYSDTADGQRWSLCGRLAGPWVDELRSCWRQARERAPRAAAIVDLKDVTFVDEAGQRLLAEMQAAGTEFIAAGVENKHLVAGLRNKDKGLPERRAVRLSASWDGPKAIEEGSSDKDTES